MQAQRHNKLRDPFPDSFIGACAPSFLIIGTPKSGSLPFFFLFQSFSLSFSLFFSFVLFLVIVANRLAGTTSLYFYLTEHPQVLRALSGQFNKEVI